MQLHLTLRADNAELPISYNHLIHGMIYNMLKDDPDFSAALHDADPHMRIYKGFCFSRLIGAFSIRDRLIVFNGPVQLEIRTINPRILTLIVNRLVTMQTIRLGSAVMAITSITWADEHITQSDVTMVARDSSIVAYMTSADGKTLFFSPDDPRFVSALIHNAQRKWQQFHGDEGFDLTITPLFTTLPRKVATRFKQTFITGWMGAYRLTGNPEVLDMLYQVGLGAKNSEGFGMMHVEGDAGGTLL